MHIFLAIHKWFNILLIVIIIIDTIEVIDWYCLCCRPVFAMFPYACKLNGYLICHTMHTNYWCFVNYNLLSPAYYISICGVVLFAYHYKLLCITLLICDRQIPFSNVCITLWPWVDVWAVVPYRYKRSMSLCLQLVYPLVLQILW